MNVHCACRKVEIELKGEPILCAACHCGDCQEGSRRIEALPGAPAVLDAYGGTEYVLFRKDRVKYLQGQDSVEGLQVEEGSPKRVYAPCCNSFLLLALPSPMHWVSVSRARFPDPKPPLEVRMNVKPNPAGGSAPKDVPAYPSFPVKFAVKVLGARIAMFFGS